MGGPQKGWGWGLASCPHRGGQGLPSPTGIQPVRAYLPLKRAIPPPTRLHEAHVKAKITAGCAMPGAEGPSQAGGTPPQSQGTTGPKLTSGTAPCWAGLASLQAETTCQSETAITCLPGISNQEEGDTRRPTPGNTPCHASQKSEGCTVTGTLEGSWWGPGASSSVSTQTPPQQGRMGKAAARGRCPSQW